MFLYKQLRLGNLEPKYIPNEYRDKILALLKEEKEIKQKQIKEINQKNTQLLGEQIEAKK